MEKKQLEEGEQARYIPTQQTRGFVTVLKRVLDLEATGQTVGVESLIPSQGSGSEFKGLF